MLRQLPRLLLPLLTTLSLLLLLATIAFWVRSYWDEDELGDYYGNVPLTIDSKWGKVDFLWSVRSTWPPPPPLAIHPPPWAWHSAPASKAQARYLGRSSFLGIEWSGNTNTISNSAASMIIDFYYLAIPYYLLCLPFLLFPALHLLRRLRHRRYPPGLCQHCGYDLRASQSRCPECGAPFTSTSPSASSP